MARKIITNLNNENETKMEIKDIVNSPEEIKQFVTCDFFDTIEYLKKPPSSTLDFEELDFRRTLLTNLLKEVFLACIRKAREINLAIDIEYYEKKFKEMFEKGIVYVYKE